MKVLIIPVLGKFVKDTAGRQIPPEGRYYSYGPYWIRMKNRGLVEIAGIPGNVKDAGQKPKKGYYNRVRKGS
jgi:hypothetical protein